MRPPIIITGCPRSGVSLLASIVAQCGAWGGNVRDENRCTDALENEVLRQTLSKAVQQAGGHPEGMLPLPDPHRVWVPSSVDFRLRIGMALSKQGLRPDQPWYFKSPLLILTWPCWVATWPDATWLVARRPVDDIVASCKQTQFLAALGHSDAQWRKWVAGYTEFIEAARSAVLRQGGSFIEVSPELTIRGDFGAMVSLAPKIGLSWPAGGVRLRRHRDGQSCHNG